MLRASEASVPAVVARRWPLASLLALETRAATAVYYATLFGLAAALFIPQLLPMVDYPQHVAMAEMAHRMADPSHPLHDGFSLNYFTYNGFFQWAVAALAPVMSAETAGRLLVGTSIVGLGAATVALLRTLDRPPGHAAFLIPALFASPLAWGFANYAFSVFLGVVALVFICRTLQRPQRVGPMVVGLLGLWSGFAHVLGTLLLCALALAFAPEVVWRAVRSEDSRRTRLVRALGRVVLALSPLLLGSAYCIAVYVQQYQWNPAVYRDPTMEGTGPDVVHRLQWFTAYTTGLHVDATDQVFLGAVILLGLVAVAVNAWARRHRRIDDRPLVLPFVVGLGIYLCIPMVFIGTHIIFPRFGQTALFGLLFLLPRGVSPRWRRDGARLVLGLGAASALNFAVHMRLFAVETDGLSRVIDAIPPGRRVTAVIYEPSTYAFRNGVLIHTAGYYGARTGGEYAFNFARYASVPLNFKPYSQPAWPVRGWEFTPEDYDPRGVYARYYDVVVVRAPTAFATASDPALARLVFDGDAVHVRLLARDGRYAAFDAASIPP
ncbi:MAG: hypothetical protein AAGN82_26410 [Myxococcota bacterium]